MCRKDAKCQYLLAKGADPKRKELFDSDLATPFYCLCVNQQKDMFEKVILLAEYGADIKNEGYIDIPASWEEMSETSIEEIFRTIIYLWENGVDEWHAVGTTERDHGSVSRVL